MNGIFIDLSPSVERAMMWNTVTQIGSGLTLVAFLIAATVTILRVRLQAQERQLLNVPEGDRATLVQALNDSFLVPALPVDPANLLPEQQYSLLLEQIRDRARRFYATSVVIALIATLAGGVTIAGMLRAQGAQTTGQPPSDDPIRTSIALPPTTAASLSPADHADTISGADSVALSQQQTRRSREPVKLLGQPSRPGSPPDTLASRPAVQQDAELLSAEEADGAGFQVLQSARLLRGRDQDLSILEIMIENHSSSPFPLRTLTIRAEHPRSGQNSCMAGDPEHQVTLNWDAILRNSPHDAAWVDFAGTEVAVHTSFQNAGRCSSYRFSAVVPLTGIVPPRQLAQILLRIREIPPRMESHVLSYIAPENHRQQRNRRATLADWGQVHVSLTGSGAGSSMYPRSIEVTLPNN